MAIFKLSYERVWNEYGGGGGDGVTLSSQKMHVFTAQPLSLMISIDECCRLNVEVVRKREYNKTKMNTLFSLNEAPTKEIWRASKSE